MSGFQINVINSSRDMEATEVPINRWAVTKALLHTHICNKILLGQKKKILSFVIAWMDLEGIVLIEISRRKTNSIWFHLYVESKEQNKQQIKLKQTHKHRKQTDKWQRGGVWGTRWKAEGIKEVQIGNYKSVMGMENSA